MLLLFKCIINRFIIRSVCAKGDCEINGE